jgi:hypothetical protein
MQPERMVVNKEGPIHRVVNLSHLSCFFRRYALLRAEQECETSEPHTFNLFPGTWTR